MTLVLPDKTGRWKFLDCSGRYAVRVYIAIFNKSRIFDGTNPKAQLIWPLWLNGKAYH